MKNFLLNGFFIALAFLLITDKAFSQTCSGTVSNGQNLVTNGDFSQGYTGWTHDPAYIEYTPCSGCYSVPGRIYAGSNPNSFNNAFPNEPDHTSTSADNNFLMVDGICTEGINLFSQSNIPIAPNTNYYFTVWITSLSSTSPYGTLNFNINGVDLPTTISAPGTPGTWIKYTASWYSGLTPPATTSISIQNTTTTGCNTAVDFGIDDISFSPGCEFGGPGPLPDLGPDFSICGKTLPFNINPNFNAATAARADITYKWYKDGVLQTTGLGPSFYNYSVSAPGTYTVCADSAGNCPKSDILNISNSFSIDLGPDLTLCNPITAALDAGYSGSGVTYQWYKNSVAINGETNKTLTVSNPATYSVDVTDPSCGVKSATITITTSAAVPNDSTFCPTVRGGVTHLSVTGTGKYKWWSTASGAGTVLATGNSYTTPSLAAPGPYTYYVEDTSTFALTVGPPATGNGFTGAANMGALDTKSRLIFDALTSFRLDTITVLPYNYYCPDPVNGNHNIINIIITDATGAIVGTSSYSAQCNGTGQPAPPMKVPVGINIPQGSGYTMKLNTGSTQFALYLTPGSFTYPTTYGSAVTFASNSSSDFNPYYNPNAFPGYFDWKITKGINCQRVPVTATLNCGCAATAPASVSVNTSSYCVGSVATITLSVVGGSGTNLVWYSGACGTGTVVGSNTTGADITITAPSAPTTYYARWETVSCNSICKSVTVTPVAAPTVSSAGNDQKICNSTSATLAANAPSAGTGAWSVLSGTGTVTNVNNPVSMVTGLVAGDLVLQWTISNSPCPSSLSQVTIHKDTLTAPVISGSNFNPCGAVAGATFGTTLNYAGTKYSWSASGALVITSATNINPITVDIGTAGGTLTVTDTNGVCILSSLQNIIPVQAPVVSAAGPNQKICNASSTILAGNAVPAGSVGTWSIVSGTGSIADIHDSVSTVSQLIPGDLELKWTISNSCGNKASDVIIHKDTLTAPVISGSTFSPCASTSGVSFTTTFNYSGTKYNWSASGSLVITSASNINPVTVNIGTSGGTLTVTDTNGACILSASQLINVVQPPVTSVAGTNQSICNASFVTLNGNTAAPSGATGTWAIVNGTGSITDIHDPASTVSGLVPGDLILSWTISNSPCADSVSQVIIHKDSLIAPVLSLTGASYDTCASTTGVTYATTVDHSSANIYTWSGSGTLVITGHPANTAIVNVGASGGTLTVTEVSGVCSLSASKAITISPSILPPAVGPDQIVCTNATSILASAGSGKWTVSAGAGTFDDDTDFDTRVTAMGQGSNTFTWTVNGCGGPYSADIHVSVITSNLVLSPIAGPSDTLCIGTPRALNVSVSGGSGSYSYLWVSSDSTLKSKSDLGSITVTPTRDSTTYTVYAIDKINFGCVSAMEDIEIHAIPKQNLSVNNLVTPNEDQLNDKLIVRDQVTLQKVLPGSKLEIFNEWGSKVFSTDNYDNTWGAKDLTDGIYYYHLKTGCGGEVYKGWVQIIR
jgi:hypothetical protein